MHCPEAISYQDMPYATQIDLRWYSIAHVLMQLSQMCMACLALRFILVTSQCLNPQRPALYRRCNRRPQKQRLLLIGRSKRLRDAFSLLPLTEQICVWPQPQGRWCGKKKLDIQCVQKILLWTVQFDLIYNMTDMRAREDGWQGEQKKNKQSLLAIENCNNTHSRESLTVTSKTGLNKLADVVKSVSA